MEKGGSGFMKRLMVLITVVLFVFALIACKNKDEKIVITIGMWTDETAKEDVEMFKEWKRRFENDYPQYEIKGQNYEYNVDTFLFMAETGTIPTVFQTWFTEPQKLIANGYVKDITDELKALGWYDKMDPEMREALSAGGRTYGVPRDGYGLGLFMNLKLLEEAGLIEDYDHDGKLDLYDPEGNPLYPQTFDELLSMASTITETLEYVAGFMVLSANKQGGWQFSNIAWNFGADLQVQENGKWVSKLNSPGAIAALEWIKKIKHEYNALPSDVSLSYNDWWSKIGQETLAMCIVGSDAIATPFVNMDKPTDYPYAFVPMPAGPNGDRYSLFGGTPYMFSAKATSEQVMGALRFLEYMGRSPEMSDVAKQSIEDGMQVALRKGMPILPSIKPWINEDYVTYMENMEQMYCNVNMNYFKDFYALFDSMKRTEEPYYCQEMYKVLDGAIQTVLDPRGITVNVENLLTTINNDFQKNYMNNVN